MRPQLSEKEKSVLLTLGQKQPGELDPFERHIRAEIGRLSMAIEQGNTAVDRLKGELSEAEQALTQDVGAFQATARTFLAYADSNQGPKAPLVDAPKAPQEPDPALEGDGMGDHEDGAQEPPTGP